MSHAGRLLSLSPGKITGSYLAFGIIWILLSDRIVLRIAGTQTQAAQIQTIKGWLFVVGSALLVFGLTRTRERQIEKSRNRLNRTTQELQVLHRLFRHNIRNNLNVVLGYINLARDTVEQTYVQDWLDIASTSTQQFINTSEKLRIIERAEFKPHNFDSINVVNVIQQEVGKFKSTHPDVSFDITAPDEAWI